MMGYSTGQKTFFGIVGIFYVSLGILAVVNSYRVGGLIISTGSVI